MNSSNLEIREDFYDTIEIFARSSWSLGSSHLKYSKPLEGGEASGLALKMLDEAFIIIIEENENIKGGIKIKKLSQEERRRLMNYRKDYYEFLQGSLMHVVNRFVNYPELGIRGVINRQQVQDKIIAKIFEIMELKQGELQ